jgi:hypothetical protein
MLILSLNDVDILEALQHCCFFSLGVVSEAKVNKGPLSWEMKLMIYKDALIYISQRYHRREFRPTRYLTHDLHRQSACCEPLVPRILGSPTDWKRETEEVVYCNVAMRGLWGLTPE